MPWTLSGMEDKNRPVEESFKSFLDRLCASPSDHIRFLNMLSLLEHMGSRKIMLSQMNKTLTLEILKHIAEETRHAFFFKRHAEKLAGEMLNGYENDNTMCATAAKMYFGRLDATISRETAAETHPEAPYLWVSLIIELRACWVYHMYQDALQKNKVNISLKSVIAEEDLHMADMYARLTEIGAVSTERLQRLCQLETDLFKTFFKQLDSSASQSALKAA
jgi:hypothetical protein